MTFYSAADEMQHFDKYIFFLYQIKTIQRARKSVEVIFNRID